MRAQIQVIGIIGLKSAKATILEPKDELQNAANNNNRTLCALGGRCGDMEVCCFAEMPAGAMLIVHLLLNVRDAMGANTIDKIAEHFAPMIDKLKVGKTQHSILSNLTIKRLADATVIAAIRRGWVQRMFTRVPRRSAIARSRRSWGSWVVFPLPVAPETRVTGCSWIACSTLSPQALTGSAARNSASACCSIPSARGRSARRCSSFSAAARTSA